jgi:hypothetical protein
MAKAWAAARTVPERPAGALDVSVGPLDLAKPANAPVVSPTHPAAVPKDAINNNCYDFGQRAG